MNKPNIIWLASYPRSGNTLLRTVLWHCFGLRSASIYPNDLGGRKELENYVGHIEHGQNRSIQFQAGGLPLLKTHEPPTDQNPAIYVVRDARAASVSLWQFYREKIPLDAVIAGEHRFGTWTSHLEAWKPWERPNTLFIKYEEITSDLPVVLNKISRFLDYRISASRIPDRETLVAADGRWIRGKSHWQSIISAAQLAQCNAINQEMLEKLEYLP